MQLDRNAMVRFTEERLARTTNERHRRNLVVLLSHMRGEIEVDVDMLLSTLADNVTYHTWGRPDLSPKGKEEVRVFYNRLAENGFLYFQFDIDRLVVDDDVVVTEGVMQSLVPTRSLASYGATDDGGAHLLVARQAIFWPFDKAGHIIGEDSYSSFVSLTPVAEEELPSDYVIRLPA